MVQSEPESQLSFAEACCFLRARLFVCLLISLLTDLFVCLFTVGGSSFVRMKGIFNPNKQLFSLKNQRILLLGVELHTHLCSAC